jgi:hypothetical protein
MAKCAVIVLASTNSIGHPGIAAGANRATIMATDPAAAFPTLQGIVQPPDQWQTVYATNGETPEHDHVTTA